MRPQLRRKDIIEPELSYEIVGAILDVSYALGHGLKEAVYQKAVGESLKKHGLKFKAQVYCQINFNGSRVGYRYLDFLIEDKIIIELKSGNYFPRAHIMQTQEYLTINKLQLAILATFTSSGVNFRRVVNIN